MKIERALSINSIKATNSAANDIPASTPLMDLLFKQTTPSKHAVSNFLIASDSSKLIKAGSRTNSNSKSSDNTLDEKELEGKDIRAIHTTIFVDISSEKVQDMPDFDNPSKQKEFQQYIAEELKHGKQLLTSTIEYHLVGALQGAVKDSDGTMVKNLSVITGLSPTVGTIVAETIAKKNALKKELRKAKSNAKKKLSGKKVKGFVMLCGTKAFEKFEYSKDVTSSMENNQMKYVVNGSEENQWGDSFHWQGVDFVAYEESIGDVDFLDENTAILCPLVEDLYELKPAPPVACQYVNKKGKLYHVTVKEKGHDVGLEYKIQCNYTAIVKVPPAVTVFEMNFEMPELEKDAVAVVKTTKR